MEEQNRYRLTARILGNGSVTIAEGLTMAECLDLERSVVEFTQKLWDSQSRGWTFNNESIGNRTTIVCSRPGKFKPDVRTLTVLKLEELPPTWVPSTSTGGPTKRGTS